MVHHFTLHGAGGTRLILTQSLYYYNTETVIGFVPEAYLVTEGSNLSANLNVELISGQLGRKVIVNFDTFDGSAAG